MNYLISQWNEIERLFNGTLLIGNGASVAVDQRFHYSTLKEEAVEKTFLTADLDSIFQLYDNTTDFELILRSIWQASEVNKILNINEEITLETYSKVKKALINTVRSIHPLHDNIGHHMADLYKFSSRFEDIICLNYDLILYWIMMFGNSVRDGHIFKDCFSHGEFEVKWRRFIRPIYDQKKCTMVFYPHGNLIFARNDNYEFKIHSKLGLLDDIFISWENSTPLFISEGTFKQKEKAIYTSTYLSTVFREVLTDVADNVVIYGWDMGEQDLHIIKQLSESNIDKIAVSVYNSNQYYCDRVTKTISRFIPNATIYFFDSKSSGCWVNA